MTVIHAHDVGAPPAVPVLTDRHVAQLGVDSVRNLARLAFRRAHRQYPQYDEYLDAQHEVVLVRITHDLAPAAGTFSRYEVGDVLIAWVRRPLLAGIGFTVETTAYAPRVGWNCLLVPGTFEVIG